MSFCWSKRPICNYPSTIGEKCYIIMCLAMLQKISEMVFYWHVSKIISIYSILWTSRKLSAISQPSKSLGNGGSGGAYLSCGSLTLLSVGVLLYWNNCNQQILLAPTGYRLFSNRSMMDDLNMMESLHTYHVFPIGCFLATLFSVVMICQILHQPISLYRATSSV